MFRLLGGLCTFGDIPEVLITSEIEKMLGELKRSVAAQGFYLACFLFPLAQLGYQQKSVAVLGGGQGLVARVGGMLIQGVYQVVTVGT